MVEKAEDRVIDAQEKAIHADLRVDFFTALHDAAAEYEQILSAGAAATSSSSRDNEQQPHPPPRPPPNPSKFLGKISMAPAQG